MHPLDQVWDRYVEGNGLKDLKACPLCGFSGRFEGFDESRAGSGRCPACGSNGRARLYGIQLGLMDLGASDHKALYFNPDPSVRAVLEGIPSVVIRSSGLGSIEATGKKDGEFDLVLCNYLMDRVPDEAKALGEIRRILAPGGVALLSVFFAKEGPQRESVPRKYTREAYEGLLRENGFSSKVSSAADICTRRMCALMDINPEECVTLATKTER